MDGSINYILLDLGVFGSYESIGISDRDSLTSCSLPRNSQQVMKASEVKYSNVRDFVTLYMSYERIDVFW